MRKWEFTSAGGEQELGQNGNQGWNSEGNTKESHTWKQRENRKQTSKHAFGRRVVRGMFALLCSAALVLSDALPIPGGLPDTVKADTYPRKGTITFYKYSAITKNQGSLLHGDNTYRDTLMIYNIGGTWYSPNNIILGDDNWPVGKVEGMIPHFDPDALTFQSRVKYYFRRRDYKSWRVFSYPMFIQTRSPDGSYMALGNSLPEDGNKILAGHGTYNPFGVDGELSDGKFTYYRLRVLYTNNGDPAWGQWVRGKTDVIWGDGSDYSYFRFYDVSSFTYTCINSDYTIGTDQVYVADRDLFLREGVKLTIPDGSVLCVKNGPFYVNGEIECYGTILVEDGGIIMPYESEGAGSRIVMKEGGAMIIRSGGRVYAGCPKDSLWTKGNQGWLDMYAGSSIINFGLLVAGQCNFKYGQATIENHDGAKMFLGYSVSNEGESKFMTSSWPGKGAGSSKGVIWLNADAHAFGLEKTGGGVHYGTGSNQTVLKVWDGASTWTANKSSSDGQTVKLYSYDKDGKCTIYDNYGDLE